MNYTEFDQSKISIPKKLNLKIRKKADHDKSIKVSAEQLGFTCHTCNQTGTFKNMFLLHVYHKWSAVNLITGHALIPKTIEYGKSNII